jgi:hypothetical protein
MRIYEANGDAGGVRTAALERKPIRPETALESILHANPALILDEQLLIIGRQVRLDSGVADLIGCDQFGNVVVCEVKIGRSGTGSASEETILSQPQNYASSLSKFDYDDLDELFRDYRTRLDDGEWDVDQAAARGGTVRSTYEATFGIELDEHEFNSEQRLVVVAEEITRLTAANVRYLLEQGLHFQCTEVKRFALPDEGDERTVLACSVVVDYDIGRVQPARRPSLTYPELVATILERAFPEIQSTMNADSISDVLHGEIDSREHRLVSNNPSHPDSVVYRLGVKPDDGVVRIGIDIRGDDDTSVDRIQMNADMFTRHGFEVTGNETYRVVIVERDVDSPTDARDDVNWSSKMLVDIVELGHEILTVPEGE